MIDLQAALLDSWDRQARIVSACADLVTEANKRTQPTADGMPLFEQLAHIHSVRRYWLSELDNAVAENLPASYMKGWEGPTDDLARLKELLALSAAAVREIVSKALTDGSESWGGYDNPVLYLQHMIWHEGWHVGQIFQALRSIREAPTEEWEETHVWGEWRTENW